MNQQLGQKLLADKAVTQKQLQEALARQRLNGGRVGHNLVALGYLSPEELNTLFQPHPEAPKTLKDTGLDLSFICELALKHLLPMGEFKLAEVAESLQLPSSIVDTALEILRREKAIEVKSAAEYVKSSFRYTLTEQGKIRAGELMEICRYAGPAPVPLASYKKMVELQTIKNIVVDETTVRKAFSHLIIAKDLLKRLGPAISSGKPMFLYGPPGNGKTTIAETIGKVLPDAIYLPHAIIVGGQIITVFDPVTHIPVSDQNPAPEIDQRWVRIRRPAIITGGELTLKMLDLEFNPIAKFYEAPLQMKANNGLFIIDDFGRQQMNPHSLLNRWIVNLDRNVDYMALHTGMKFDIPFDQLVIFSTNIEPKTLVDEAFLRRIRYKIKIDHPTEEEYGRIFERVCQVNAIPFDPETYHYLLKQFYRRLNVAFNCCHPRDIIDHIIDDSRYYNHPPQLTRESIHMAWENYFVEA